VWQYTRCRVGNQVVAFALVVDAPYEEVIDVDDFPRSGLLASRALSACNPLSYTIWMALRQDVDKLCIDDSKFQINDSTLQIGDSTLQIGDSTLRIVDLTLPPAGSDRRLDVTKLRIGDLTLKRPRGSSISPN